MLEPEDRPWMRGHKRPLAPPPAAMEPQGNSEGVEILEAKTAVLRVSIHTVGQVCHLRQVEIGRERKIFLKDQPEIKFPREPMPSITIQEIRMTPEDPERIHKVPGSLCRNYIN